MEILIKPVITEKMSGISEKQNKFGFIVNKNANKIQIKKAVEQTYGVVVEDVNTMIRIGKTRTRNTKSRVTVGRTSSVKKAIVSLAEGNTIDFYSNI